MGFLILAVACSLGIATVFKLAERRDLDRTALLAVNYAAAAVLAVVLQGAQGEDMLAGVAPGVAALGVAQGVLYIGGFWLFARAIREAGIGLAAGAMRLSVVVPVVASWAVWGEAPTRLQGTGLLLAGVAFVLLARSRGAARRAVAGEAPAATSAATGLRESGERDARPRGSVATVLALLFLTGGIADVLMKAFQTGYAATVSAPTFLLFVFGVAFGIGAAVVVTAGVRTGRWPRPAVLVWGAGLGVINYASAEFFLRALGTLPAPVAFPLNNVLIVLGAALLGRLVWGERFSSANAAGLGLAAVAVFLLAR